MSPDSTNHRHGGNKEAANQILSIGKKFESMDDMEHITGAACCSSTTHHWPLVFIFLIGDRHSE